MQLELAILSRRGGRNYNEDACGHWHSDSNLCCVVADGAGGHGGGDKASKLAVQHVIERYSAQPSEAPEEIRALIVDTNRSLIARRGESENTQNMHSTIVALFIDLEKYTATWGHCGDSRLYGFRGGRLAFQTRDHSLVQSLVDGGLLPEAGMRTHPQRSELLSALGVGEQDLQVSVSQQPWAMQPGDAFLLCTDGVWEYVIENELEQALGAAATPQAWLDDVEQRVLAAAVNKPRHDNFSGLAVWVTDSSG